MTLLVILAGIYIILGYGYFKMVSRAVPDFDYVPISLIALVSSIWPVALAYTLAKEAVT